jgi:origin recognition complex subunit 4
MPSAHESYSEPDALEGRIDALKKIILAKITGRKRVRLSGLQDEYNKVHQLLEQTVLAGEGNSMMVIGSRGSGKTTVCSHM